MARPFVVMWLENNSYPADGRVRREAQSLVAAGWDVTVVSPRAAGQARRDVVDAVRVVRYRRPEADGGVRSFVLEYGVALVMTAVLTLRLRLGRKIDVIHAHNPPDVFFPIAAIFKIGGTRFVFDHHDLSPEMYDARFGDGANHMLRRLLLWSERATYAVADKVIVTNESYKAVALGRGKKASDDVTVVRNGPDLAEVYRREPDSSITERASLVLGYVGELGPQDGVDHLVRAVHHLDEDGIDVHAMVVGDGPAREALETLARELGVEGRITFTGWLETSEVMSVLSSTSIGVGPDPSNPYNDRSTMIKLTEYLALGLPVVAYDLPENRHTCGDAARYVGPSDARELADAIALLWRDEPARVRMSEAGVNRAREVLAWDRQVPALLSVYESVQERATR
jgi:glycosyltransferase involved in cell wall biosynthesis